MMKKSVVVMDGVSCVYRVCVSFISVSCLSYKLSSSNRLSAGKFATMMVSYNKI